jgi:hypothetical protein
MKNKVILTLMTVSFALAQAAAVYAEAPTVRDWPDICIGDIESVTSGVTEGNVFVFEDAFDVREFFVSDDTANSVTVKWSFLQASGNEILINGVPSLDGIGGALGSTSDPIQPDSSREIAANNADDATDAQGVGGGPVEDGNEFTLTFRDADLSPIGGPNVEPGGTPGDTVNTSVLTVFASDNTTATSFEVVVKTVNQGTDTLSGGLSLTPLDFFDFSTGALGWTSFVALGSPLATAAQGPNGLCVTVNGGGGTPNAQLGQWNAPSFTVDPTIDLVNGAVYRARYDVFTDQTTADAIPVVILGYFSLAFGGDVFFVDVVGGANGFDRAQGLDVADVYITPMPVRIGAWQTGAFQPLEDGFNDISLGFQIPNVATGVVFSADSGTMCLRTLQISSGNINDLGGTPVISGTPTSAVYGAGSIVDSTLGSDNALPASAVFGGSGVTLTVAPVTGNTAASNSANLAAAVGFIVFNDSGDGAADNTDTHPIPWNDQVLLDLQLTASSTSGGSDPVNAVVNSWLAHTSEVGGSSFITAGSTGGGAFDSIGVPTLGENRVFTSLLFTSNATLLSSPAGGIQFVPSFVNRNDLHGSGTGADPVLVSDITVNENQVPLN